MTDHVGEEFVRCLAAQDAAALKDLMAPTMDFRALTPGAFWERDDPAGAVDDVILGTWFTEERRIRRVLQVECARFGDVEHVAYRFRTDYTGGERTIEQHAYIKTENDKICSLRILCSGFIPG